MIGPKIKQPSKASDGPYVEPRLVLEAQSLEVSSQVVVEGSTELVTHQMCEGEASGSKTDFLEAPMSNFMVEYEVAI